MGVLGARGAACGKAILDQNKRKTNKIFKFWRIHFTLWKKFRGAACVEAIMDQNRRKTNKNYQLWQIHFVNLKNKLINLDKYQGHEGSPGSMCWSNVGSKQTENTLIFQHMPNPKWMCHGHDGVLSDFNVSQLSKMMRMSVSKKIGKLVFLSNLKDAIKSFVICAFISRNMSVSGLFKLNLTFMSLNSRREPQATIERHKIQWKIQIQITRTKFQISFTYE